MKSKLTLQVVIMMLKKDFWGNGNYTYNVFGNVNPNNNKNSVLKTISSGIKCFNIDFSSSSSSTPEDVYIKISNIIVNGRNISNWNAADEVDSMIYVNEVENIIIENMNITDFDRVAYQYDYIFDIYYTNY